MSTDAAWEAWGRKDPYFGVITHAKFRRADMTREALDEFFESGRIHAAYVMDMIREFIDPGFKPVSILDFGCGVGRLLVPFSAIAAQVTGADVSPSMLEEARRNCEERGAGRVRLVASDDALTGLEGTFDLVHSYIVFQHIPVDRGRALFGRLLRHVADGGIGALHFTYSKRLYAPTFGMPPAQPEPAGKSTPAPASDPDADPEMQMNCYPVNEMLFRMQEAGIGRFHAEFTDHGGELGLFLFFRKPAAGA